MREHVHLRYMHTFISIWDYR